MKKGREKGARFQRRETTMTQRLQGGKEVGLSQATLSNVTWPGFYDQEAKQGGCRLQILWEGELLKSVGLCELVGASDQLSSM